MFSHSFVSETVTDFHWHFTWENEWLLLGLLSHGCLPSVPGVYTPFPAWGGLGEGPKENEREEEG